MPRNGSLKSFPHALTIDQHREAGTALRQVRGEVLEIVETLRAGYGKSDDKARHGAKILSAIDGLKSLLSRAMLIEHAPTSLTRLDQVYYPPEPSA